MTTNQKSPFIAILLSFFPGGGQFYMGNPLTGVFYLLSVTGLGFGGLLLAFIIAHDAFFLIFFAGAFLLYIISFIHTAITIGKVAQKQQHQQQLLLQEADTSSSNTIAGQQVPSQESDRFFTIALSLIPGVGHFHLGLMNRGLTFITAFLGAAVMVIFVAIMVRQDVFLLFMAFLPVVWIYSFFDAMQQLNKKQRGEPLEDRSILEDLEKRRADGHKSKAIATLLSIFPGAGHLYLGYQRRGIQLMAAFLFSMYILDALRLGIFMFLLPIIWFYSFFDGLQKASNYGEEPIDDQPVIAMLMNHQRWIGVGLIVLGGYYLFDRVFLPSIAPRLYELLEVDIYHWYYDYFQTIIICILLIGGGIKLMSGSKKKEREQV